MEACLELGFLLALACCEERPCASFDVIRGNLTPCYPSTGKSRRCVLKFPPALIYLRNEFHWSQNLNVKVLMHLISHPQYPHVESYKELRVSGNSIGKMPSVTLVGCVARWRENR